MAIRRMKSKLRKTFVIEIEYILDKIEKGEHVTGPELKFLIYFKEHFDDIIYGKKHSSKN